MLCLLYPHNQHSGCNCKKLAPWKEPRSRQHNLIIVPLSVSWHIVCMNTCSRPILIHCSPLANVLGIFVLWTSSKNVSLCEGMVQKIRGYFCCGDMFSDCIFNQVWWQWNHTWCRCALSSFWQRLLFIKWLYPNHHWTDTTSEHYLEDWDRVSDCWEALLAKSHPHACLSCSERNGDLFQKLTKLAVSCLWSGESFYWDQTNSRL